MQKIEISPPVWQKVQSYASKSGVHESLIADRAITQYLTRLKYQSNYYQRVEKRQAKGKRK